MIYATKPVNTRKNYSLKQCLEVRYDLKFHDQRGPIKDEPLPTPIDDHHQMPALQEKTTAGNQHS
jgi:hypothetical protein